MSSSRLRWRGSLLWMFTLALVPVVAVSAWGQSLPKVSQPEQVGFSSQRLERITETFQREVDSLAIPGAVVVVARDGKIAYEKAIGYQNREERVPMKVDSIFRIASMSKPITTVAAMMLVEDGKLDISAPVSQYLPEFSDLKVGPDAEPVKRPMTVQDLLRHTSGLAYEFFVESPAIRQAYHDAKVFSFDQSLAEMVTKLAHVPLAHQPGTFWEYSMSTDVLGRIVEVASGMALDQFVEERIAKPLRLTATGFSVSGAQDGSVAQPQIDASTGKRPAMMVENATAKPKWLSGGGGMFSTAEDYARFAQMLLNGGELDGVRLLSPKTVTLMTADHLPPGVQYNASFIARLQDMAPTPEMGQGFGLGFKVRKDEGRNPLPGSVGDFGWNGIYGTLFWVDPNEKLVAVLMVQNATDATGVANSRRNRHEMRELVYQALLPLPQTASVGLSSR
jgi:CubicO group peptidase (beta-lactamase class C family)